MNVIPTGLADCVIVEPKVHGDARGFFMELYNRERALNGRRVEVAQINASSSVKGVLRGLHFQAPLPQGKLVWAAVGEVFDVAVDLRKDSPTFGKWEGVILSEHNKRQLWIPEGFAHGFQVTSANAVFCYACTEVFKADFDRGVHHGDPALNIEWPDLAGAIVSDKDRKAPTLANYLGPLFNEDTHSRR
jgi:dTDP-4-dehydrorhamnose 3,5-epimerase